MKGSRKDQRRRHPKFQEQSRPAVGFNVPRTEMWRSPQKGSDPCPGGSGSAGPGARSDSASGRSSEPPKVLLRQLHSDEHLSNGDARGGPPSLGGRRGPRARRRRRAPRPAPRFPPAAAASAAPPIYGERYQGGKWRLRSPRSPGVITFTHTPARTHTRTHSHTGARRARLILAGTKYNIHICTYT